MMKIILKIIITMLKKNKIYNILIFFINFYVYNYNYKNLN